MRILQVSNRVPWPLNEGGTIGIYNFTKAFAEAGHEVFLYCLDGLKHNTPIKEAERELSKYATVLIHPIDTDLKPEEALKNLFSSKSYNVERFDNGAFRTALAELLQKEKFDVVQLEGSYAGPYLKTIRKHHKGILSLRMHNVEHQIWERLAANSANPIKKLYLNILAKRLKRYEEDLLGKVDTVIPVTKDDAAVFKQLDADINVKVIPAGIDNDYWEFSPTKSITNWYHLGSLEWMPNREAVDWYLNEWHPLLENQLENYRFHLAGKGIDVEDYEASPSLELYTVVHDAFNFVESKDICVVPLLSGSGIRLKILEAMSAGKLVVSTTVGAQGLQVENGKHLLIANNAQELQAIIAQLKSRSINIEMIIKNARELVDNQYSISAAADNLLEHYLSVSQQNSRL